MKKKIVRDVIMNIINRNNMETRSDPVVHLGRGDLSLRKILYNNNALH